MTQRDAKPVSASNSEHDVSKLDKLKMDEWDTMLDVSIKVVLYGLAAVLPTMREQQ